MLHVVLFRPEIPQNSGNVIRLCANAGAHLHLVSPLGFSLEDRYLRRAGLDYHELANLSVHRDWNACLDFLGAGRQFAISTRGATLYTEVRFEMEDVFVFGPEGRGLPPEVLHAFPAGRRLRLPMRPDNRSLNLSNAVAILVFEAWRQWGFPGAKDGGARP